MISLIAAQAASVTLQPSVTDAVTAWSTLAAVVVALLIGLGARDWLRHRLWQPRLGVTIRPGPPDCHIIETEIRALANLGGMALLPSGAIAMQSITGTHSFPSFYCRLRVENTGSRMARQVHVRMTKLWRYSDDGVAAEDQDFLPLNLKWSHLNDITLAALYPELPQHCDLCHVVHEDPDRSLMDLDTQVTPNQVGPDRYPTRKPPGRYRAQLALYADNVKPIYKNVEMYFTAEWYDDAEQMAQRGLHVTVV
jgi:hypothetical protein